jgi:hypothetical protein
MMKTKMKSLVFLLAICGSFGLKSVEQAAAKDGEVWVSGILPGDTHFQEVYYWEASRV